MNERMYRALRDNQIARFAARLQVLGRERAAIRARPRQSLRYLLKSREISNFTYELANPEELANFVAELMESSTELVRSLFDELCSDHVFIEGLAAKYRSNPRRDDGPRFGSRLGYYAITRIGQPGLVVETGTHDGLGAAVLLRALERNAAEGKPGTLFTFDVGADAGWLIDMELRRNWTHHTGDTRETLEPALRGRHVDIMIHDSLHTHEHESFELETALRHAASRPLLISDDAHITSALSDLCDRHGVAYRCFREQPDHFYPGKEIGAAFFTRTTVAGTR